MEAALVGLAKVAAAVALGVPLVLYFVQDRLIFFPQPLSEARRAEVAKRFPAVEEVTLRTAEGLRLHGWFVKSARPAAAPLVLYFGGNAEEVSAMLESIGDPRSGETPGAAWLLLNYRGYGASEGAPSEAALLADALAIYDHAVRLPGIDTQRVYALGRSLGSGIAVHLARERPLAGVILVTPFDSLVAVAQHHYPYLPVRWMLRHRFDSIALAPELKLPLLCFIAERDEVIPPEHAERLFREWAGPKRRILLAQVGHNDVNGSDPYWSAIREFLGSR